jgi:hypothetical protein
LINQIAILRASGEMDLVLLVIAIGEILDDGIRLPQDKVIVIVIDDSRDAFELIRSTFI